MDTEESPEAGLKRELQEELAIEIDHTEYFTEFSFDFSFRGLGKVLRRYYLVLLNRNKLVFLKLGKGLEFIAFTVHELLVHSRVVPYDAFAVWLNWSRLHCNVDNY